MLHVTPLHQTLQLGGMNSVCNSLDPRLHQTLGWDEFFVEFIRDGIPMVKAKIQDVIFRLF